jgi:hypothetical protein
MLDREVLVALPRPHEPLLGSGRLQRPIEIGHEHAIGVPDHIGEHRLPAVVIPVEGGRRDADFLRETPHAEPVEPFAQVQVAGVGQNVLS